MIVDIDRLTVVFRRWLRTAPPALDQISLRIDEGEAFALVGPEGAGKSTALHCMLGLVRPTSGRAHVFGRALEPGCAELREIAVLPDNPRDHGYLTIEEAVRYDAILRGAKPDAPRITRALEQARLDNIRTKRLSACSKGVRQKVAIARCLLQPPRLVIADDPMRDLDPVTAGDLRDALVELHRGGATIVMTSRRLSDVEAMVARAGFLSNGKLVDTKRTAALTDAGSPRRLVSRRA